MLWDVDFNFLQDQSAIFGAAMKGVYFYIYLFEKIVTAQAKRIKAPVQDFQQYEE